MAADDIDTEEARELKDLDVREVSLVDSPAIRRRFAVVKRLEGETVGETTEVEKAFSVNPRADFPAAPEDLSWSFTAEEGNEILGEDQDWLRYRSVHLISDPDNLETKDGHKTPVAKLHEGRLKYFRSGLNAAIGALSGARGGVTGVSQDVIDAALARARSIRDDLFGEETEGSEKTKNDEEGTVGENNTEDGTNVEDVIDAESEVVKQTLPMLTALANEKMSALTEAITAIQTELSAGTLTKDQARDMFSGLSSLLWRTEDDVFVVAKSLDVPIVSVDKARRMTTRRIGELKTARDTIDSLLSELEDEMAEEPTTKTEDGSEPTNTAIDPKVIAKAVTDAVTAAVEPLNKRLDTLEEKAGVKKADDDSTDTDTDTDTNTGDEVDIAKTVEAAVTKALEPVNQRLDTLEADPGSEEQDTTDTEVEKSDPKPGEPGFWSGVR